MSVKIISKDEKDRELIMETVRNARNQDYTPEMLCELQKVIETKYYYWWLMDMKGEEYAPDLFGRNFHYFCNGHPVTDDGAYQALTSKWVNSAMVTMHMGHQPLVWLMDENNARGVFQYEDHHVYKEDDSVVETWMVYCDDFEKDSGGTWHITTMRMYQKQADGRYRDPFPPKDWVPEGWKES
ncbi:nuclear transport factor 2 family protein [[Clostridium] hylemonae]|uniref:nuclear transport factor 2 family protein n=1 Tax=[Clostridium] hylemonae TaxID=89153 RepID=UPI001FCAC0F6|nr:nuclear transport factor 2 family protein [[Clostridium] hylemonae]BDF04448.1 hypothetical protein CE91St63_15100 [[Clostridium] hylemonae]